MWDDPHFVRVSVVPEQVVNQDNKSMSLQWFEADSLRLFDMDKQGVVIRTNNSTDGKGLPEVFFSREWTSGDPFYLVRPADAGVVCTEGGVSGVKVGAEQNLFTRNSIGVVPAMGKVTGNRTAYRAQMKNLTGTVAFAMTDSTVASVTISSVGGEPVSGVIDVDYAKLENNEADFWTIAEGAESSSSVVVRPVVESAAMSDNNTFHAGTFYANVLPQTYSQGLKVVATFGDGKTSEQIIPAGEGGLVVPRSGIVSTSKTMDDTLPDEFEFKIDFTGAWPLKEPILAGANQVQSGSGDKYTYEFTYTNGESKFTTDLPVYIFGNKVAYTHTSGSLRMMAKNSRIMLPAIYGRYLKSVKMEVVNTSGKGFELVDTESWATLIKGPTDVLATKPGIITFPAGNIVTEKNKAYYMRFHHAASTFISTVTLTYSTTLD